MAVLDRIEFPAGKIPANLGKNQAAHTPFSRMSNSELLRFGVRVKFRCSEEPTPNGPEAADLAAELDEARFEWNRRHPELPLRNSF